MTRGLVRFLLNDGDRDGIPELVTKPIPERDKRKEILSYFLRNPNAADSFEGLVRWRLLDEAIHQAVHETRDALEWLVTEGYLCRSTTAGSAQIFSLNAEKRKEAERFVLSGPGRRKRRGGR